MTYLILLLLTHLCNVRMLNSSICNGLCSWLMSIPDVSVSAQSCTSEQSWIVTSAAGCSISVRSQSETICLFTHRCHFCMGFVPFTPTWFSNLLWLFSQWILTSPQRHHLKVVGESFHFPWKKLSRSVMSMVFFPFSIKTLKHSSHEFSM